MTRPVHILITFAVAVLYSQSLMAQCNTVDAVTTASFKITGGQACSTFADLNWTFTRSNGTMTIRWGTSTSYGSQKSVYSAKPVKLTGLTPSTTYYYAVDGSYEGRSYQYTRSSFKTSAGATAANKAPVITSAASVACTTGTTKTYTVTATDADNDPVTFTASGLPNWITFASPALTLKPITGSTNASISIIAADGKGGLDTLQLAVTVTASTGISSFRSNAEQTAGIRLGSNSITFPVRNGTPVTMQLFSLNGTSLSEKFTIGAGNATGVTMQLPKLSNGIYMIRATWQGGSAQQKMVIGR
jgi:hypothetical protein